ncbi:MAG: CpsB/CapC family capsule biosynthesis tyrosine phosphatase, partial [Dehalococcoidia bacterium]
RIVRELADTLNAALRSDAARRNAPAVRIFTGMTNRLDTTLPDLVDSENAITLNRTRFLLVEPPYNRLPSYVEDVIGRLLTQRLVPVLAHPERNVEFQRNPKRLQSMVDDGVIVQIAACSLTGQNGTGARRAAEQFIRRGMAHVVASEMHTQKAPRSPILSAAFDIVADLIDENEAYDLFEVNPDMILEGRSPRRELAPRARIRRNWFRMPSIEISNPISDRTRRRLRRRLRLIRRRTRRG